MNSFDRISLRVNKHLAIYSNIYHLIARMTARKKQMGYSGLLIVLVALAVASCSRSQKESKQGEALKLHSITVGLREDGKLVSEYEGSGMAAEIGWVTTNRKDFQLNFKGMHLPRGSTYILGDTNYLDSTVVGTASIEGNDDDQLACNLRIDSKVPITLQFVGIADITKSATNEADASFTFLAGKHDFHFMGKLISVLEVQKR